MGKYNTEWSQEKYERFIQEGRGQGRGSGYRPWLTVTDYPSLGRVTRILGWKTKRIHHLFSDIQTRYFYYLEWSDIVDDVRESSPLLEADEVIKNKKGLNFNDFRDKETGFAYVLQTTFLITIRLQNGELKDVARTVKAASELERKLTLDSLEIQRRYWEAKNIQFRIITNKDISVVKAKNIEWIHSSINLDDRDLDATNANAIGLMLMDVLYANPTQTRKILTQFDKDYTLGPGTALAIFKYLIANRVITVNMDEPIDLNKPANHIILSINDYLEKVKTL